MPLRKRLNPRTEEEEASADKPTMRRSGSRRQRILDFFRSRMHKKSEEGAVVDKQETKGELLTEDHIHSLFSGAPHFAIYNADSGPIPAVSFPWDFELTTRDVSDCFQFAQPAYSACTLRKHLPYLLQSQDRENRYDGYDVGVAEIPSMPSAQGLEPGSIGFVHFMELPTSDNLVTDLQQSQSSNGFLESIRNKEQMQTTPEKLGIRKVDMGHVYDRLAEFGDLVEAFQDSPERITILNNQSSGDLYANLFGKFLMPPSYDSSADDPTGMKVQINTLLKVLRQSGAWYDFSLVEWRIRLGQILWSDDEAIEEMHPETLWTEREILLLQLTLACELLLRLDAITSMEAEEVIAKMHVHKEDYEGFLELKTRKTDWDLVLARRFLDNITVMRDVDVKIPKARTLLSMLSKDGPQDAPKADIVFLPRHQERQLSGLIHFAETVQWPGVDLIVKELSDKLGIHNDTETEQPQASTQGKVFEPTTPSSISIYGTPLATPRSGHGMQDSYFGHLTRPQLDRNITARSLTVPLSSNLLAHPTTSAMNTTNVGGWLSRSFLTGLVLPGEPIAHFLMSTLLENDKLAIAALGDSANLYGGFVYADKSWWSKSSVVARVLGSLENAKDCMGWIFVPVLPADLADGWYAVTSDQVHLEQPPRIRAEGDMLAEESALIPAHVEGKVKPGDLALPQHSSVPPVPSVQFVKWMLTSIATEPLDNDTASAPPPESDTNIASLEFASPARKSTYTLTLTHDVQFVTSFPCTSPSMSTLPSMPQILKRSLTLSRSSSKRSIHNTSGGSNRLPRVPASRRNSHGFEPLLSHPPDSPSLTPTRAYSPIPDDQEPQQGTPAPPRTTPMSAHPLHISYAYQVVPVADVIEPAFTLPFKINKYTSPFPSNLNTPSSENHVDVKDDDGNSILVLDARSSKDLELLARAWCAQQGLHAIIGRTERTCLACCIREARGLGIRIVIRV
ncbi:hypothetical protein BU24DRAFT_432062 [Aaosphaeria arxii CBS 175.79]|uniref:Uncharacterized protein n=1 Tax=Aaosphaeria arxii CBS 175.79 TaxID=1450172 RepID=A0A6A5XVG7_9PLEO|nr:uncharacterized protein BU24DRAFT_432062 [Aaosphaeria arxii CBS 175.79]KAF2017305.1 hypothetical protein BU24DRAFT_432062 [Aaosphaeria arxii CBS 175.79]